MHGVAQGGYYYLGDGGVRGRWSFKRGGGGGGGGRGARGAECLRGGGGERGAEELRGVAGYAAGGAGAEG